MIRGEDVASAPLIRDFWVCCQPQTQKSPAKQGGASWCQRIARGTGGVPFVFKGSFVVVVWSRQFGR